MDCGFVFLTLLLLVGLANAAEEKQDEDLLLDYDTAVKLAGLSLECYSKEWPHKFGLTYESESDLGTPRSKHPTFYGCFDWHSAVHGHWLMTSVLNRFPETELGNEIVEVLDKQITEKGWSSALKQLSNVIINRYKEFLPSLAYAVRVGEHPNTAFGLIFAMEYAQSIGDTDLVDLITHNASSHFGSDAGCPLNWEPSGYDFLSPCLQEADLMAKIIGNQEEYITWLKNFLPQLFDPEFHLEPGQVLDQTDGKLVHLHGVNFSRAWNLYSLITKLPQEYQEEKSRLLSWADEHLRKSKDVVVSNSDYASTHWLASFLLYALQRREDAVEAMA